MTFKRFYEQYDSPGRSGDPTAGEPFQGDGEMSPEVDQDQAVQSIKARGLEGWDAVSAGVTLGVDEDRLRAEFKPDTSDLDWSASYNYILFGVGPGHDGGGAAGHASRRTD